MNLHQEIVVALQTSSLARTFSVGMLDDLATHITHHLAMKVVPQDRCELAGYQVRRQHTTGSRRGNMSAWGPMVEQLHEALRNDPSIDSVPLFRHLPDK